MPKIKKEVAYDAVAVQEYIKRRFEIERELSVLREDKKELNKEFKEKIDGPLISKIIRLVKLKVQMEELAASPDTIEEVSEMIKEKVNMVM